MSDWIPVEERLPEEKKRVLIASIDWPIYNPTIGSCYFITGGGKGWICETGTPHSWPTHWQELPEPPKC